MILNQCFTRYCPESCRTISSESRKQSSDFLSPFRRLLKSQEKCHIFGVVIGRCSQIVFASKNFVVVFVVQHKPCSCSAGFPLLPPSEKENGTSYCFGKNCQFSLSVFSVRTCSLIILSTLPHFETFLFRQLF